MPIRTVLAGGLMLLLATCNLAAEEQQDTSSPDAEALETQDDWVAFKSPERGFTVSFPEEPKTTATPVEGMNPLTQYSFAVSLGDDVVYNLVVFEYPDGKGPNPPDAGYYNKVMKAYAKGSGSRLRKKGPATIADRSGYEATATDTKRKLYHLIDIVPDGDRVYLLVSAGPRGHATSDEAIRFRDSFRILED